VVKRKGIENAIELVSRLGIKARLVISHASGDEGHDYEQRIIDYSRRMQVNTLFVSEIINDRRGTTRTDAKSTPFTTSTITLILLPTHQQLRASAMPFWRRSISASRFWSTAIPSTPSISNPKGLRPLRSMDM
jgi:hypothetical protein